MSSSKPAWPAQLCLLGLHLADCTALLYIPERRALIRDYLMQHLAVTLWDLYSRISTGLPVFVVFLSFSNRMLVYYRGIKHHRLFPCTVFMIIFQSYSTVYAKVPTYHFCPGATKGVVYRSRPLARRVLAPCRTCGKKISGLNGCKFSVLRNELSVKWDTSGDFENRIKCKFR
jgi:hypothetical protein